MTIAIQTTAVFDRWMDKLEDDRAVTKIIERLERLEAGHFGDHKTLKDGVSELRIHFGPGYRVYFARRGQTVVVLLAGGDKGSQDRDIIRAIALWREMKQEAKS